MGKWPFWGGGVGEAISGVNKGGGVLCMPDIDLNVVQMKGVFFIFCGG